MRPFLSYYGAKWAIANRYPRPLYNAIVEPFAGSAGYSIRHAARQVTLIDAHPAVAGAWRYLINATPDEIRRLPLLQLEQRVDELEVHEEARWLIGWWVNKGSATPKQSLSAWAAEPRYARQFWGPAIRDRLARQVPLIKHWTVIEGDYREHPDVEATWFVDPPYSGRAGRQYPRNDLDYTALAEWCKARSGQVIACENSGADWLPFEHLVTAKATSGKRSKSEGGTSSSRSSEAIWVGGTSSSRIGGGL